jgi:(1->4)-alpha-D-glucan 1-alpha-D-glucosylmutase
LTISAAMSSGDEQPGIPRATYRIQLRSGVGFAEVEGLLGYLRGLGVSHLYLSPILTAVPNSPHGYDAVAFDEVEPALGGIDGFRRLAARARDRGLRILLDFVPNHMGASIANKWWRSVLEWGEKSPFSRHFDIDWGAPKLLMPILGEPYGEALRSGLFDLHVEVATGTLAIGYRGILLPLSPPTYARLFGATSVPAIQELALRFAAAEPGNAHESKASLIAILSDAAARQRIEAALRPFGSDPVALHDLLEAQPWRVSYWRMAREGLTYGLFF